MKKSNQPKNEIKWLKKPEAHNYTAALSYLNLVYPSAIAADFVKKLKNAPIKEFKAKDIFRASKLSLLGVSNTHVEKNRKKIKKGIALSPILLVRDTEDCKVIIADGYHRMCGVYAFDENAVMPCQIV
jgi:hypothetical protein